MQVTPSRPTACPQAKSLARNRGEHRNRICRTSVQEEGGMTRDASKDALKLSAASPQAMSKEICGENLETHAKSK